MEGGSGCDSGKSAISLSVHEAKQVGSRIEEHHNISGLVFVPVVPYKHDW